MNHNHNDDSDNDDDGGGDSTLLLTMWLSMYHTYIDFFQVNRLIWLLSLPQKKKP